MYGNPYYGSTQVSMDRIDNQIKELESMRAQLQQRQQPAINQTFQLAPNGGGVRFVIFLTVEIGQCGVLGEYLRFIIILGECNSPFIVFLYILCYNLNSV